MNSIDVLRSYSMLRIWKAILNQLQTKRVDEFYALGLFGPRIRPSYVAGAVGYSEFIAQATTLHFFVKLVVSLFQGALGGKLTCPWPCYQNTKWHV